MAFANITARLIAEAAPATAVPRLVAKAGGPYKGWPIFSGHLPRFGVLIR
jgi:hypothetical protein